MSHKIHLQHTVKNGPTCQAGKTGGQLRGEHFTAGLEEFNTSSMQQCQKCKASKLFAFLMKQSAKQVSTEEWQPANLDAWEPEDPEAWKLADDALIKARRG